MARRRRTPPRIEDGTGRVVAPAAVAKPKPGQLGAKLRQAAPPPGRAPGANLVYPTPVEFPGLVTVVPTPTYTPGPKATQPSTDQYGNPVLPGSAADRPLGTSGYNTGKPGSTTPPQTQDHSQALGLYGLPPEVATVVDSIFRQYPNDPNAAAAAAIAYVRGTDWYKATYPGIDAARQKGFIGTDLGSERDYKQYYNSYNHLYMQYYGRPITAAEAANLFGGAVDPGYLGKEFYGAAYWQANKQDANYLAGAFSEGGKGKGGTLTESQGSAYGREVAGIDTQVGQSIQNALQRAQARMQTIFGGSLATPNLTIGGAGLAAPSLTAGKQSPDVAS